ncbi:MAG: hypothetical protein AAGJ54_03640 [Planctomycetota bacterium]
MTESDDRQRRSKEKAENILDQYLNRTHAEPKPLEPSEPRASTRGALTESGGTPVIMLDLRFGTGNRVALPYSYLQAVELDPSKKLVLTYADRQVTIRGRHLDVLHAALTTNTAIAITESAVLFDRDEEGPFVEKIDIEP